MSRTKGTPKTGGRTKGTPNKTSKSVREWISSIIDKNRRQIVKDLKEVDAKERLRIFEKLLQYVIPKQQTQLVDITNFDLLSDDQIKKVIDGISQNISDDEDCT